MVFSADRYLVCSFRCSQYRSVALRQLRRFHPGCACCAACDISDYHQECPELVPRRIKFLWRSLAFRVLDVSVG